MASSTTNVGDFFANVWGTLTAETLDEEDESAAWRWLWTSLLCAESRKPKETYDYIYYEERDRPPSEVTRSKYCKKSSKGGVVPVKDRSVSRRKNYKIDVSELPTTIAVVSQSPAFKNRFMAQEYKEISGNMKTLLEIEEEDLNSAGGIDLVAAHQAKEQVSPARPKGNRVERVHSYPAVAVKGKEKKQKSRVSEKEGRSKKRVVPRSRRIDDSGRISRSSHSP